MTLILGVTAGGKGALALKLAEETGAHIISIDSMKVYKRMDIGTAKPSAEARRRVPYHLIDVVEPSESFSVADFLKLANSTISRLKKQQFPIVAVGGTALYIKALLYGLFEGPGTNQSLRRKLLKEAESQGLQSLYNQLVAIDPQAAERIHPNDSKRIVRALEVYQLTGKPISQFQNQFDADPPISDWKIIGLAREKTDANSRINKRVKKMIEAGLVEEVKSLLAEENPLSPQAACAIGYAEIIRHLKGEIPLEEAVELIKKNTRRFAKSQRTWFRTFKNVHWLDIEPDETEKNVFEKAKTTLEMS